MNTQHKFEIAGLGKAPFKFVGVEKKVYVAYPGAPAQPAGTCDYCGNGILWCCMIRDTEGRTFIVGNECVKKTGDEGLKKITASAVRRQISDAKFAAKQLKDQANAEAAQAAFRSGRFDAELKAQPHPTPYMAAKGLTKYDYFSWIFECTGYSKQASLLKYFEGAA